MKILILSISAGSGHEIVAQSLKHFMESRIKNCSVEIIDALKYINPIIDRLIIGGYLKTIRNTPHIYGRLYNASNNDEYIGAVCNKFNDMLIKKVESLIDDTKPDVIVCTHPFHLKMLEPVKKKGLFEIPVIAIITDFSIHSFWIADFVDAYVIPQEDLKIELTSNGINDDRIYPYGIPVNMDFYKKIDRQSHLNELNLEDKTTFLLMGGGLGLGSIKCLFKMLIKSKLDIQIIAATGKNSRLKKQLEYTSLNCAKKVKILGFTDKIYEYMSVSDLLITKPGGITISEAMAKEIPIAIISPIPGQEEENCNYLVKNGMAIILKEKENNIQEVYSLVNDKFWVENIKNNIKQKSKPDAIYNISNLIAGYAQKTAYISTKR